MAGILKHIKEDGKVRRTLAAWLGICMVLQMALGSIGTFNSYADDTMKKTITVSEQDILAAVKKAAGNGPDETPRIDEEYLPFADEEQRDEAETVITPYLMGTAIVSQEKLEDNCTAIVAASGVKKTASGSDAGYLTENVVFIGINGSKDRDCEFTLQITNARNVVIRSMTIIGYAQKGAAATSSDASGSDASDSDASDSNLNDPEATNPDLNDPEATDSNTASNSEMPGLGFKESYRYGLGENELKGLLATPAEIATPGQQATPTEPSEAAGPVMEVEAGGIGVAYGENRSGAGGKIAKVEVFTDQSTLLSGATGTIHVAADYSVVDGNMPESAYFTVEIEVKDHKGNPYKGITGPESESNTVKVEALEGKEKEDWDEVKKLLEDSDNGKYNEAAGRDDWLMVHMESNTYYYSAASGLAIFGIKHGGSAITDMPLFYKFDNGTTPIGSTITATPGVLNRKELKDAYEASSGPAHSGDAALIVGEPATIASDAKFYWHDVTKTSGQNSLGNLTTWTNADKEIIYQISAAKDYQDEFGRLYTKQFVFHDVMTFDGFYLDLSGGYSIKEQEQTVGGQLAGELFLFKGSDKITKILGLKVPGKNNKINMAKPIYLNGDHTKVTGFEVNYNAENNTLGTETPVDMDDTLKDSFNVYLGIGNIVKDSSIKNIIKYEGSNTLPAVKNKVDFDAYSLMYDEAEDNSSLKENDGVRYHHSSAEVSLNAVQNYTIKKEAFKDEACKVPAVDADKIFEPDSYVYYKITAENQGYADERFKITDTLPEGLDSTTVKTVEVISAGQKLTAGSGYSDGEVAGDAEKSKTWGGILIPSGGQAEIIFKAKVAEKEKLKETTLLNRAGLFRDQEGAQELASANVTVFANLNTLQAGEVDFQKKVDTVDGNVFSVGSDATFILHAALTEGVQNFHWITVTDTWPDAITLKKITNIPAKAIVVVTDGTGKVLQRYENTGTGAGTIELGNKLQNEKGVKVTAQVYLSQDQSADMKLTGTILSDGEIINSAHAGGGEGPGWEKPDQAPVFAIGAAIEKKAYYISQSETNITEKNYQMHPVDQNVAFRAGDIVGYSVKLVNKGNNDFKADISDDIAGLFGTQKGEFVKAKLGGQEGFVFMKDPEAKWKALGNPTDTEAFKETVNLKKDQTAEIFFFVMIPEKAEDKSPENTAEAKIEYGNKTFDIKAKASITINEDVQKASIEKETYAVARELEEESGHIYLKGARWKNSALGEKSQGYVPSEKNLKVGKGDYVLYRITINNKGDAPLKVYETEDWLPEGMEIRRFYEFNGKNRADKIPGELKGTDTLDLGTPHMAELLPSNNKANYLYYADAKGNGWDNAAAMVNHSSSNSSVSDFKRTYRARLYGESSISNKTAVIPVGKSAVYGVIAQVTGDFERGKILTNTAGAVVDKTAIADTGIKEISELTGSVGGQSYSDASHKIITATSDVEFTSVYTPGIEKKLTQYQVQGEWKNYTENGKNENFLPTTAMRWQITLHNGTNAHITSGSIENFIIKDTLPAGLGYNGSDMEGNYISGSNGMKVSLPAPKTETVTEGDGSKTETVSWIVEKLQDSRYRITGADGAVIETEYDLSIPVKKTVKVQVGTKSLGSAKYGTYVNQAELIPDARYAFTEVCQGTAVKDNEGKMTGVRAQYPVNIFFGDGKTEAYKQIEGGFNGTTDTGDGRDSSANTILADAGSSITYTLNVENQVANGLENLVIADRLPAVKDNGLVNNMPRQSDFTVLFADDPKVNVVIKKAGGTSEPIDSGNYRVSYTRWNEKIGSGSALPAFVWEPNGDKAWSNTATGNDSIRIEINNQALDGLLIGDTVAVTFCAVLPKASDLSLEKELIAWNTFGYAYKAKNSKNKSTITVEPPKVGVQIPTASLSVTKIVESQIDADKKPENVFTFAIEKEDLGTWSRVSEFAYTTNGGTKKTAGDGTFVLSHGQTADFTVLAGRRYRIMELNAEGYYVAVKSFDGGTGSGAAAPFNPAALPEAETEEMVSGRHYYCTFTNSRSSLFLPETGGMGTVLFHRKGSAMMLLSVFMMAGCGIGSILKRRKNRSL